jgi:hypothetical protein
MYPHERSLVKTYADKPYALLGINSDEDPEVLKVVLVDENITWRSWWDGNTSGPIHTQWQVELRPAVFVLDANGVIRYKDVLDNDLDEAIETLLAELEARIKAQ